MNLFDAINSDEFDGLVRHAVSGMGFGELFVSNFDLSTQAGQIGLGLAVLGMLWSMANKKYMRNGAKPSA